MSSPDDPPAAVPVIETGRLLLHGHRPSDLADCLAMWADPAVTRHIGGKPSTEEEVWHRILRYAGHWALMGFGYWAVRERDSGRFVGEVGLADFRRSIEPGFAGAPEAGWVLAPWAHGRGYATEAVRAALAWGDARFGAVRTVCLISPDNGPSLRVAERCGFAAYAHTTYKGSPCILLERHG